MGTRRKWAESPRPELEVVNVPKRRSEVAAGRGNHKEGRSVDLKTAPAPRFEILPSTAVAEACSPGDLQR